MLKRKALITLLVIAGTALLLWSTRSIPYYAWDFHNTLWGPVNMLVHHQTPYTYDAPYGPYPAVWMPSTLGFFFFFGYFPFQLISRLWLLAEIAGFIWVIWLVGDYKFPAPVVFVECLVFFAFFPPLWVHVFLGQFSIAFVILLMIVIYLPQARRYTPLLLALGLTKPQLAVLIYPGLLVREWRQNGFRGAAWLVLSTALCAALMTLPLFLYYPAWMSDFISVTFSNLGNHWGLPTLFVQLPVLFGQVGYLLWGLAFLAALVISLWLWSQKDAKTALVASLAMTPMVTPYASSWDFLLMLPAFFWLAIKLNTVRARVVLFLGMLALFLSQLVMRWHRDIADGDQWWVPPLLILLYLISLAVERWKLPGRQLSPEVEQ